MSRRPVMGKSISPACEWYEAKDNSMSPNIVDDDGFVRRTIYPIRCNQDGKHYVKADGSCFSLIHHGILRTRTRKIRMTLCAEHAREFEKLGIRLEEVPIDNFS